MRESNQKNSGIISLIREQGIKSTDPDEETLENFRLVVDLFMGLK